jgi:hypothetical protein
LAQPDSIGHAGISVTSERIMPHGFPVTNLTAHEWRLLIAAVAAYQHNADYRAIHMKLLAQQLLAETLVRSPIP